jgi:hypothetical protein
VKPSGIFSSWSGRIIAKSVIGALASEEIYKQQLGERRKEESKKGTYLCHFRTEERVGRISSLITNIDMTT